MLVSLSLALLAAAIAAWLFLTVRAHERARGVRVVHCPATGGSASLRLHPAGPASVRAATGLEVVECSLWPQRRHCAQACLAEVKSSPLHCVFRRVLADWYQGRACAFCQREIGEVRWGELRPALLSPGGEILAWSDVPPSRLYEILATHRPVCASCDVAETFRRRHADWVVERPREEPPAPPPA
jgi:hypothetical protein